MTRCLVTGGSGFVGIGLVRHLLDEGNDVVVFDRVDPAAPDIAGHVQFERGDVRDAGALVAAARGSERFFHIAAVVPLTRAGREFWEINVGGTENAVAAALAAGVEHFVHLSSSAIYGVPHALPLREDAPAAPFGQYGHSKWAGEEVVRAARERGLASAVLRPRTVIGPGRLGIFDLLFEWIDRGGPIFMLGAGDKPFQLLSNRDLADAMWRASQARAVGEYNVGADRYATLREDLHALAEAVSSPSRMRSVPAWLARPVLRTLDALRLSPMVDWHYETIDKEFWYDNERPRAELGWNPRDSNVEMLTEAYRWFQQHRAAIEAGDRSVHRSPLSRGLLRLLSRDRP